MAHYTGKGWHFQHTRHSNARKYGRAGGKYKTYKFKFDVLGLKDPEVVKVKAKSRYEAKRKLIMRMYPELKYKKHFGKSQNIFSLPEKVIDEITGLSQNEKNVLNNLNYEFYESQNLWSVKKGDTKYVMLTTGLSRKKSDELIMKVLNKLEEKTKTKKDFGTAKRKHTTRGELYDKVRDALYDGYDSGDVPEYLTIKNKNKIIIKAEQWEGAGVNNIEITPEDVIEYYDTQARNITSGIRTLSNFSTDWRMVDNMAKESLEIFKVMNPEKLRTLARKHDMTAKF